MNSKKTIQKVLIALLVAVVLLVIYSLVSGNQSSENGQSNGLSSLLEQGGQVNDANVQLANTEILRILGSIQNIQLNDDIFSNPVFRDLRDTQFTIPRPLAIGRPNPFLPIGFDNVSIQSLVSSQEPQDPQINEAEEFFAGQEV